MRQFLVPQQKICHFYNIPYSLSSRNLPHKPLSLIRLLEITKTRYYQYKDNCFICQKIFPCPSIIYIISSNIFQKYFGMTLKGLTFASAFLGNAGFFIKKYALYRPCVQGLYYKRAMVFDTFS